MIKDHRSHLLTKTKGGLQIYRRVSFEHILLYLIKRSVAVTKRLSESSGSPPPPSGGSGSVPDIPRSGSEGVGDSRNSGRGEAGSEERSSPGLQSQRGGIRRQHHGTLQEETHTFSQYWTQTWTVFSRRPQRAEVWMWSWRCCLTWTSAKTSRCWRTEDESRSVGLCSEHLSPWLLFVRRLRVLRHYRFLLSSLRRSLAPEVRYRSTPGTPWWKRAAS